MRILLVFPPRAIPPKLSGHLAAAGFDLEHNASLAEARERLAAAWPDCLLLSRKQRDGDAITLVDELRRTGRPLPILIHDPGASAMTRIAGLDAGADDYLAQWCLPDEIVARLRALVSPFDHIHGSEIRCGPLVFDTFQQRASMHGKPLDLSFRETQMLALLARRAGMVASAPYIESQLFASEAMLGSNVVAVTIHRLRAKLREAGGDVRIATVKGIGYRLQAEPALQAISR